jgi:hypothetical protein
MQSLQNLRSMPYAAMPRRRRAAVQREAANEDIPDALRVQRFAEREEVFELRCA